MSSDAQLGLAIAATRPSTPGLTVFRVAVPPGMSIVPALVWAGSVDDLHEWWRRVSGQRAARYELRVRFEGRPGLRGITHADFAHPNQVHPDGWQWIVPWPKDSSEG